ncbi:MAG TPA: DNA polymerase III subunit gamma/tau [Blastocatellia bacterium]|nr:DNA polymerase III subunit gamma/tau [Blastocatellia bacterium]
MTYQVIARKWRPQTFDELVGQEAIARTLQNAISCGRLHHAYIFAGPRGVGKTTTARVLAKALNCATGPTTTPCNRCPSCEEIARGTSLDVLEIDAASHTGVDNVRDVIINNLAIGPARDRYRIFIIDEFHQLSSAAFNALLKTLEEPPPHVLFIMATTELHKVPPTIISRCQLFEFRLIAEGKIFERLRRIAQAEGITISDAALRRIARAGEGSMRDAQSVFDQVISFAGREIHDEQVIEVLGLVGAEMLAAVADAIADQDGGRILRLVDDLVARGVDLRAFTRELMSYFRHLLVVKTVGPDPELLPVEDAERALLLAQADRFSEEDIVRLFHALAEVEQAIRLATEPRFQLEIGLVKLAHLQRVRPLADLIRRIEALQEHISTGSVSGDAPGSLRPAPATVPAVPPSGATDEIEAIKQQLIERGKILLATILEKAQTIEITGDRLRIVFARTESGHRETVLQKSNAQVLTAVAQAVTGRTLTLDVVVEANAPSEQSSRASALRAKAEADPVVRALVKTFKGEIVDVVAKDETT